MTAGALVFMIIAWSTILGSAVIFLGSLLKYSKQ